MIHRNLTDDILWPYDDDESNYDPADTYDLKASQIKLDKIERDGT